MPSLLIFNPLLPNQVYVWKSSQDAGGIERFRGQPGHLIFDDQTTPTEQQVKEALMGKTYKYMKVSENGFVVEMSPAERAQIDSYETAQLEMGRLADLSAIEDKLDKLDPAKFPMAKVDAAIDNIQNLADAKTFLKKFVRGVVRLNMGGFDG